MTHSSKYFYGNKISDYGLENKRVDYKTLSQAFDAVLNNDLITELSAAGYYFESENDEYYEDNDGNIFTPEEVDDRREELQEELDRLQEELDNLNDEREEADTTEADQATLEAIDKKIEELEDKISDIERNQEELEDPHYKDIFQYFIVDDNGADILRRAGETLFYNDKLDLYIWGVDHWGTSWDYVLTNIYLDIDDTEED